MTTIETKKRTLVRAYLAEFKAPIRIDLSHGATSVAVACRMFASVTWQRCQAL
jgi:hypothetical protein